MTNAPFTNALLSGLAGASALTFVHETARRVCPDAPRMDTLGRRSIAAGIEAAGYDPPPEDQLQALALGGDLISNTLYYSLAAIGNPSFAKGAALGAAAGLVRAWLSRPIWGLVTGRAARTPQTAAMTFCWYLAGGLVASAIHHALVKPPINYQI